MVPRTFKLESARSPAEIVAALEVRRRAWKEPAPWPRPTRAQRLASEPWIAFRAGKDGRFRLAILAHGQNAWQRECFGRLVALPGGRGTRVEARFVGLPVVALPAVLGGFLLAVVVVGIIQGEWVAAVGTAVAGSLLTAAAWAIAAVGGRRADEDDEVMVAILAKAAGVDSPAA